MKRNLITIFILLVLTNCSAVKTHILTSSIDFETSDYIAKNIAEIPIAIKENNLTINLINSASADKIVLIFKVYSSQKDINININCKSQCGVEFAGDIDQLQLKNLKLHNVHLVKNSTMKVEDVYIYASEAITTGLPIVSNKAEIKIESSEDMLAAQKLLKGVDVIPGSGEYIYDTKIVYDDKGIAINSDNDRKIANASYNIQNLTTVLPNLEWVAPVVSWFGVINNKDKTDLDVNDIEIMAGVENKNIQTSEIWHVANYNRENAHLISKDDQNRSNSGGTTNDESLLRYIASLKQHNLKVMFYPLLLLDVSGKPWRGYIKARNPHDIHHFFTKKRGYNEFILHYAKLLKGKVDAFVIGSEMQELTQTIDPLYSYPDQRRYPAVIEFIDLAKQVKEILGNEVIVTYAANWGEYHHDKNQFHHLDSLWASQYVDVVGIDAYLPITNKSMGDISLEDIKAGWQSGELWDYYYDRNKKSDISPEWGLKRIEFWWGNEHWSHGIKSQWQPKMKPIWFTEFGFPSMHLATNTPHAHGDIKSTKANIPKRSSGKPDFAIQMRAIRGTLEYWQKRKNIVQNMFLWAWDVRPFPYEAKNLYYWADNELWQKGHWINSKIEPISQVRLLRGFIANTIKIAADQLIIEGHPIDNTKILAKDVQYLD